MLANNSPRPISWERVGISSILWCFSPMLEGLMPTWDYQFSSIQLLSLVWLFVTSGTAAHQASLSITNSQSFLRLMSIKLVKPSNHLILCRPLLPLPSPFLSIRIFSNELVLCIRWPKPFFTPSFILPKRCRNDIPDLWAWKEKQTFAPLPHPLTLL